MIGASVDFAFAASADDVTRTILIVAKKRAAAVHALFLVRLGRIEWRVRSFGIDCQATRFAELRIIVGDIALLSVRQ